MAEVKPAPGQEADLADIITALRDSGSAVTSSVADADNGDETGGSLTVTDCAVCLLTRRSVDRSLRSFFAEFVNDPAVRIDFRKAQGFCGVHTPLLAACGDALGVAILYADLADEVLQRWRSGAANSRRRVFAELFSPSRPMPCPACVAEAEAEKRYTSALARGLSSTDELWDLLQTSSGLCVHHVDQTAALADSSTASRLVGIECQRIDRLLAELKEIIRKNDYRFRGEPWGPERDAWRRALLRIRRP
jgi:hypothetical protein